MSKEVYLIGCHISNERQTELLNRLVAFLVDHKKDFILVSHTTIPEPIIQKSVAFIYDKENPTFKSWDLEGSNHWNFHTENWRIASKYILHGASDYYHVGTLRLLLNGIKYIQSTEYDVVHWVEYDTLPDFQRALLNTGLIEDGNDFVFHDPNHILKQTRSINILEDLILDLCDGDDAADIHWRTGIPMERCEEMYKQILEIRSRRE